MSRASRHVIIPSEAGRLGRTRSEQQENLKKEGWTAGLSMDQEDKLKYLERKLDVRDRFFKQREIDSVR